MSLARTRVSTFAAIAALVASSGLASAAAGRPTPGAIAPDRLKMPSGPSSVRGLADEPSVDAFNAQLNYQVPIELPGGYGGLAPGLALKYSGSLGNGPMGIGWTLGQAKIQRSTRVGTPKFDDTDELELSGIGAGRLVSVGNGEYRVEGMGQKVRVKKVGAGFELDDGTGVHYVLGASTEARQESDTTHTHAWLVESATNPMGEQVAYTYQHDQNQVYLTKVTWGPSGVYSATLAYEARSDATKSYRDGFAVVTAQRLASIHVAAFGMERRAYQLTYDTTFQVARLAGVTSTGVVRAGDAPLAWPALAFTYATPAPAAVAPIAGIGTWRLNVSGTTFVDLDGDGAADLAQLSSAGHSFLTNQNGTFGGLLPISGNSQPLSAIQLQDMDGDARAELVQDTGNGWTVYKFSNAQWVAQAGVWPGTPGLALKQPTTTRFADLNGDGLVDAIQWSNLGLQVHMATRTGFSASRSVEKIGGTVLPSSLGRFQDANGDGIDDYLVLATDHIDEFIGRGDGTFDPAVRVPYPFSGTIASALDIELADLDRDGLMDLLKIESGNVRWFRGRVDGTFQTQDVVLANPEPLSSSVVVAVADTNGNGSQDVVWSSASGMWRMDLAGTTTAGMLVDVTNSLGMDVTFDYRSSHSVAVDAASAGTAWTSNVPIAIPVPVKKTTALGPGETTRMVSYSVRNGFWDSAEQRFGGYLSTTVTTAGATPGETSTVMTAYHQGLDTNRELRGRPITIQVFDGTGRRLSFTGNTWTTQAVTGLPDVPLLRRAVLKESQTQFEDVKPSRKTDVTYTYDGLGRATHEVDSGRLDVDGDESVKDTSYADDDTTWMRDVVCEEKVLSSSGTLVSDVQHLLGDASTVQPLCVVGNGWPRATRAWLGSENRFVMQSQTSYDAHGNPTSIIEGGVERRMTYDSNGLFPIEERVTAPSGNDLVWHAAWDTVLGVMTSVTDPNGHTTHLRYDGLGRNTGTSVDGYAPHQVIEYDWTGSFPKTTVWQFDGALAEATAKPDTWSPTSGWRQTVQVANGKGEVRYHAQRLADTKWIISDYHEVDPNEHVVFAGRPVLASALELSARPSGIVGDTLVYDPLGRLLEQDLPTGAKRTFSYVAFERTTQDTDLAPVHSVLDGKGRSILTERSLQDGTHEIVQAQYDPAGKLTQMTLSGGTVTRTFTYDTLGRLTQSYDPDLGTRTLTWDDGNRLLSETNAVNQTISYTYDALGRLSSRDTGSMYRYHYDEVRPGATGAFANLAGQLAWVEEPTGGIDVSYDELGRTTLSQRRIDGHVSEAMTTLAASGLVLGRSFDDGFSYAYSYDPAGRLAGASNLWTVLDMTPSGAITHEKTQSGVDTMYARDVLDLVSQVTVKDVDGVAIYDVSATRNPSTEITSETDHDGRGLDHSATFTYDAFSRLTAASIGSGAQAFSFGYSYDVLHNMTSRTQPGGPHAVGAMFGTYHYGEHGRAPRQLTSITDVNNAVTHAFDFDAAGRQIAEDAQRMTFDASDRVTRVTGLVGGTGTVTHAYGHDGARVKTVEPDGTVAYFFGDGTAERNGVREHDVTAGARVIARVTPATTTGGGAGAVVTSVITTIARGLPWAVAVVALGFAYLAGRRRWRHRAVAAALTGVVLSASCASTSVGTSQQSIASTQTTFLHSGYGAGPVVFSDASGHLLEERRYEPFGQPIDAHIHTASGDVTGAPDLVARDLNPLGKRSDAATGWSDHGARWMAPETGRWLSPDPPVTGPDAKFMAAPQALHPYQYVNQNPIAYWDPDGRSPGNIAMDIWLSGMEEARAAWASGVPGKATAIAIIGAAAVGAGLAGVAVMAKASAEISPEMATCGGDAECSAWMTVGKMASENSEARARAQSLATTHTDAVTKDNEEPLTFFRGDKAGLTEFESPAAHVGGQAYSRAILENGNLIQLMERHAISSTSPPSPFISVTRDINAARDFAGTDGVVYELQLAPDRALFNPFNMYESEYLVSNHISPAEIKGVIE
jgi:RHS repeat-associated protein